jgi:hypothetical protein
VNSYLKIGPIIRLLGSDNTTGRRQPKGQDISVNLTQDERIARHKRFLGANWQMLAA